MNKFILSFILGFIGAYIYEFVTAFLGKNIFKKDSLTIFGWKLYHSLYGILFLLLAYINKEVFFAGFGLGIIVQHTLTDGFRFIQRV